MGIGQRSRRRILMARFVEWKSVLDALRSKKSKQTIPTAKTATSKWRPVRKTWYPLMWAATTMQAATSHSLSVFRIRKKNYIICARFAWSGTQCFGKPTPHPNLLPHFAFIRCWCNFFAVFRAGRTSVFCHKRLTQPQRYIHVSYNYFVILLIISFNGLY